MLTAATIVGLLMESVVASSAHCDPESIHEAHRLVVAVHEGIGFAAFLETADGHPVGLRKPTIANDHADVLIGHLANDERFTRLKNVRTSFCSAAAHDNAEGGLAADVRRDDLQPAVSRGTSTRREERTLSSMLPLLLDHSGVRDERGRERKQGGKDGGVVHGDDGRSMLFYERASKGERLAIILIGAIFAGAGVGVAVAAIRLAETCIGRVVAGVLAMLFLCVIHLLVRGGA